MTDFDVPETMEEAWAFLEKDRPTSVLNNFDLDADEPTEEILAHLAESRALVKAGKKRPPEVETKDIANRDWIRREWAGDADPSWVHRNQGRFASLVHEALDLADTPLGDAHVRAATEVFNRDLRSGDRLVSEVVSDGPEGNKKLWIYGKIFDPNPGDEAARLGDMRPEGRLIGTWRSSIDDEPDGRNVHFDEAVMQPDVQGAGIIAEINARAAEFYNHIGVDAVRLMANFDVGGATWASAGFDFDPRANPGYDTSEPYGTVAADIMEAVNTLKGKGAYSKEIIGAMGLADDDETKQKVIEGLEAAHKGVISGHYSPRDVYYTGYDTHQFTEKIKGRDVVLWPGKMVLLGSVWYGIDRNYLQDFLDAEQRALKKDRTGGVIR